MTRLTDELRRFRAQQRREYAQFRGRQKEEYRRLRAEQKAVMAQLKASQRQETKTVKDSQRAERTAFKARQAREYAAYKAEREEELTPIPLRITSSHVDEIPAPVLKLEPGELDPNVKLMYVSGFKIFIWFTIRVMKTRSIAPPLYQWPPWPLSPWGCLLTFETNKPAWMRFQLRRLGGKGWLTHATDVHNGTIYHFALMNRWYARGQFEFDRSYHGAYELRGHAWDPETKKYTDGKVMTFKFK